MRLEAVEMARSVERTPEVRVPRLPRHRPRCRSMPPSSGTPRRLRSPRRWPARLVRSRQRPPTPVLRPPRPPRRAARRCAAGCVRLAWSPMISTVRGPTRARAAASLAGFQWGIQLGSSSQGRLLNSRCVREDGYARRWPRACTSLAGYEDARSPKTVPALRAHLASRRRSERAPVAQWIEQWFPKPCAQVRFLPGVPVRSPPARRGHPPA